jgi:hypothetical protein
MIRHPGRKWTDEEKAYVTKGRADGLSYTEMGDTLGRSACSVSSWLLDRSITAKRTPSQPVECTSVPKPRKPKGYTPTQLLWASAYAGDRQADLITSLHLGKRVGLGYGPRT